MCWKKFVFLASALAVLSCAEAGQPGRWPNSLQSSQVNIDQMNLACLQGPPMEVIVFKPEHLAQAAGATVHQGGPISGVNVFLERVDGNRLAFLETTDETGHFEFCGVEEGRYELWTCLVGWNELHFEVTLNDEGEKKLLLLEMQLSN